MRTLYGQTETAQAAAAVIEQIKGLLKSEETSPTDPALAELRHSAQELLADTLLADIQSASSGIIDKHLWQFVSLFCSLATD